ncbi:hypothetical protein CDAR_442101 [Caerostris darwini]|uniref:Uncharacterized protein n=1 Tax=Caerostris darwini TaxID=1538125 RepID=A0AAV4V0K5_9ARAC|nr:hypothetical protein CDAR_442101 [Caerostris darwini]
MQTEMDGTRQTLSVLNNAYLWIPCASTNTRSLLSSLNNNGYCCKAVALQLKGVSSNSYETHEGLIFDGLQNANTSKSSKEGRSLLPFAYWQLSQFPNLIRIDERHSAHKRNDTHISNRILTKQSLTKAVDLSSGGPRERPEAHAETPALAPYEPPPTGILRPPRLTSTRIKPIKVATTDFTCNCIVFFSECGSREFPPLQVKEAGRLDNTRECENHPLVRRFRPIGGDIKMAGNCPHLLLVHFCSPYRTFGEAGNSRRLSTALSRDFPHFCRGCALQLSNWERNLLLFVHC